MTDIARVLMRVDTTTGARRNRQGTIFIHHYVFFILAVYPFSYCL